MNAISRLLVLCLFSMPCLVSAHPDDAWAAQFETLARWVDAASRNDGAAVAELSAAGTPPFAGSPGTRLTAEFAIFSQTDDGVSAGPVVFSTDQGTFLSAWDILLVEEADGWKIGGLTPGAELPAAFQPGPLPEHDRTRPVSFELVDAETNQPVHARVRIVDAEGQYWPPQGHQRNIRIGWRQDVGGDVSIAGKTYAYVEPSFVARLPSGRFTIEVRKGTEYLPATVGFEISQASDTPVFRVAIPRWIDMKSLGWHAGDTHTHFLDEHSGLKELRAEDLSVIYILATKWGELITDVNRFTGMPSEVGSEDEIVIYNEETRHAWIGHTILHGIRDLVYPLTWGGPTEGVIGGYDYPAMAHQADATHAQGGLVTWAHFPYPGGELAVDISLNKIDTVDLFTWGDAFAPGPPLPNGVPLPSAVDTWYQFLNTNARLPATAGTDKMLNIQVSGSVKTYAFTGSNFSYQRWLDALEAGRTIVSTGPVVTMTANGEPIGSELELQAGAPVSVTAQLFAPFDEYPVDVLEIVAGGEVVASVTNDSQASELDLSVTINPTQSTWVAARARGSKELPYQAWALLNSTGIPPMAHTSPVYLTVGAAPVWVADDAQILIQHIDAAIDWATNHARYQTEAQRQEILTLFGKARQYYANGPSRR